MKILFVALAVSASVTAWTANATDGLPAFVNSVIDGDSIKLTITGAVKTVNVRLAGIDAPERENRQNFSETSRARLVELINKKNVTFKQITVGKYKRLIGFVYLDGKDIGLEMVREGMAWHYDYFLTNDVYSATQLEAKQNRRGLWIEDNPINPVVFRKGRK